MRLLIGTGVTIACLALIAIAAQGGFLRGPETSGRTERGVSIYDLHRTHPNIGKLPVEEPPPP